MIKSIGLITPYNRRITAWVEDALAGEYLFDCWKEIFRDVRGFVYQPPKKATPPTYDVDLAKSVARWQVANNRVPPDITNLLAALQARAI